jgi:hypothetical protein
MSGLTQEFPSLPFWKVVPVYVFLPICILREVTNIEAGSILHFWLLWEREDLRLMRKYSPMGLLWRLDGVSIPNPNHFGALGTTGGPISILNSNLLTNSDFFTGAFPAKIS